MHSCVFRQQVLLREQAENPHQKLRRSISENFEMGVAEHLSLRLRP